MYAWSVAQLISVDTQAQSAANFDSEIQDKRSIASYISAACAEMS